MKNHSVLMRKTSSGCYRVVVMKDNYSRKHPFIVSSVTYYTCDVNCMPMIDAYKREDASLAEQRRAEKHLISYCKTYGDKDIVKYY